MLHPSRGAVFCARGLRGALVFARRQKEGDGAPSDATNPYVRAFLRRRGASRRAVRRSPSAPFRAHRGTGVLALPAASSSRWPPSGPRSESGAARVQRPAEPCPRAPARSTRAGATGSRPSWGTGKTDYNPNRNIVKSIARIFVGIRSIGKITSSWPGLSRPSTPCFP
jgi:hypothetical protein